LTRTLTRGDTGDDVRRLQHRLKDLAFDPGTIDGVYGETTAQAVWAYKALIEAERWNKDLSSKVTAGVWDRMQDPLGWTPRKTGRTPRHVEVLLPEQVLVLVSDGQIRLITHVSTGSGKHWCLTRRPPPKSPNDTSNATAPPERYCGDSITPAGSYTIWAKRTGIFQGYYGDLYNATFFNGGLAIHGFDSVPYYPDSHGCVRIPNHVADYFQSLVRVGDQVFVFDGEHDPEALGPVPPPEDVASTTTAPSTTTTVKPSTTTATTTAATTTAKATTTATTPTATGATTVVATPASVTTAPPGTSTTAVP
jgi:lipoprotein-anchoring transpeptidase ErfK/SrfK